MSAIRTAENKSHDLGTANKRFKDLYVGGIEADGAVSVSSLTVGGNPVASVDNTALGDVETPSSTVASSQAATKNYVDTQVASVIDAAPEALNTLNELAAALNDDASLGTTVTNNTSNITTNTSSIATNVTNIATNAAAISSNDTDISTNTSGIATNVTNIATNAAAISSNDSDISTNASGIATNAAAISSNDTDIATNASGIATNASGIATNVANISTNATAIANITGGASFSQIGTNQNNIATNVTNISTNAAAISSNDTDISTNASGIATNAANITTNAAAIAAIDTSGQGTNATAIATNVTNIATNAAAISSNDTDISTNASGIATNAAAISSNDSDISTNASGIATNAANITTNAAAISSNDSDISTNASGIATNAANITTNAAAIAAIDTSGQGTNATAIATNVTNIATNAAAISSNDTDIATNASGIATNAAAISSNDTDIATNAGNISTNTTNISTNTTAIAARLLTSSLQDDDTFSSPAADKVASSESIKAYVDTQVSGLVDSAPAALDTLNELAAALGDDANFSTTVSNQIGAKANSSVIITAGSGLTGGGDLSSNRTIDVSGLTLTHFANSTIQTSSEAFADEDTSLMTSAAIEDKILSYGYTTASSLNLSNYMPIAGGTFTGAVEVGGNLTVRGDLLQFDNTSTAGVESVSFADKNIVIDADNSGSAVADGAGITLEGGSGSDVTLQWNAGASRLELKEGSSFASLKVDSLESTSGTVEVTASAAEKLDHSVTFAVTGAVTGSVSSDLEGNSVSISTTMASDTDDVSEGSSNLYFTNARAQGAISVSGDLGYSAGVVSFTERTDTEVKALSSTQFTTDIAAADTDDVSEGSSNLYFTNARAQGAISVSGDLGYSAGVVSFTERTDTEVKALSSTQFTTDIAAADTDDVSEGSSNLYFTNARAQGAISVSGDLGYSAGVVSFTERTDTEVKALSSTQFTTDIAAADTDDVSEGSSNLYFTNARAQGAISVSGDLGYSAGVVSFTERTDTEVKALSSTQFTTDIAAADTDDVSEGSSNLYFTNARADARIAAATTSDLSEGTNLYFTNTRADARADARIAAATTSDLTEGTNLYYTDARADARIAAATTSDLSEGDNLYFTNARADARADTRIAAASINSLSDVSYTSGSEIDNYVLTYDHTSSSWGAEVVPSAPVTAVNSKSGGAVTLDTDDVDEGSNNLYTNATRTRSHFTYGTGVELSASGELSVTQSDISTDNITEGSSNKFFSDSLAQAAISVTGSGLSKTDGTISLSTIPVSLGGTGATSASAARDALEVKSASDFAQGSAWKSTASGSDTLVTMSNEVDGHSGSWKVINRLETTSSGGNITAVSLVADFQVRPSSRITKLGSLPDTLWNIPSDGVLQLR